LPEIESDSGNVELGDVRLTTVETTEVSPRVAYTDQGEGDTTLLLFTGWCSSRGRWAEAVPELARHHRVVSFEWRGHGDSDAAPEDFGLEEMVEDALAVVEAADLSTFVPCAASHSGWVAIELFRRHRDRIPALVHADWMVTEPSGPYMDVIEQLTSPEEWPRARDTLFDIWRGGNDTPPVDAAIETMNRHGADMWMRSGREIGASYAAAGSPLAAWSTLDPPPPVLHVYGQPTAPEYLATQERFAAEHPWFHVEHVPAVSHFAMIETPEAVDAAILAFLSDCGLGGS
jgi:pimeloyl-ACP methyl ester carboxylesterase